MQIFKAVILPALGIALILITVWCWSWKQPDCLLNVEDADESNLANSNLVTFNENILKPDDTAIAGLTEKMKVFNPGVLLINGKIRFHLPGLMDPVKKFGIAGKARDYALKNNIPVYSYDLSDEKIIEMLKSRYPHEQIELTVILSTYHENIKESESNIRESVIRECISSSRCAGLNSKIRVPRDIDIIWKNDFAGSQNWRDTNGLPGYAGEIQKEIDKIKRKHYINVINHFAKQNKKVFVIGTPLNDSFAHN